MEGRTTRASLLLLVLAASPARADDPEGNAPPPGDESGRIDAPEGDSTGREILRGVLYVPKVVLETVLLPVRGSVYAYDRYQLEDLYYDTFWNRDRTLGVVPTAAYATGFGISVGAEVISTNTFKEHERMVLEATWGGTYRMSGNAQIDTGTRLGRFQLLVGGNFDRRPDDPFYGIGNKDRGARPAMLVDPTMTPDAFETFHRYQEARAVGAVQMTIVDGLAAIVRGALTDLQYSPSTTTTSIDMVYDPATLVGFETGTRHVYGEAELRWDSRRRVSLWEPVALHGEGSLLDGFGGYVHGLHGSGDFWHYGIDLQQYIRIASGPRILELRFLGEGVTGDYNEVPFTELPYLGGDFLRGYDYGRFRDRVAAFVTAQYFWDISKYADAYVFVDAGRVYHSLDDLTLDDLRAGYGVGIEAHTDYQFLFEGYISSSIDGGVFVSAAFTPIFNQRPRWR